ncbi:zinc ribbon domain-containing protein [Corynebacterium aquatimens]|uniref:Nucleic acid-binding Zn-ribbon protein n=1 Tax=Corynebacterium aquatimens TaxID=1190508 RepID=A0A931E0H5_9CORY|nr:C4-type zinc ribbon domain-containing protein [Corynebacterium aquatimens]MBG6122033.1 putative nucleic acid-binding Zn-ribbon protein [Corynebacterium aquatimens]WJY65426.1 Putative zinc ribbon domain protein [Corynebacterium aquatimens]
MELAPDKQKLLLQLAEAERSNAHPGKVSPEQEALDKLLAERPRMANAAAAAQMAVDDLAAEILRIQEDERKLKKRDIDNKRQLSAETDPDKRKDLEHDRYAAKSRIADLLYELKEAHGEVKALRGNRDVYGAKLDELDRKIDAARRAVEALPEETSVDIDALRAEIPSSVLGQYAMVGAASFNGRTCGACFVQLAPGERAEIMDAPAEELPTCTNCGALLVRTTPGA